MLTVKRHFPLGVLGLALLLVASSGVAFVRATTIPSLVGAALLVTVAVGLLLLKPWAYWIVVSISACLFALPIVGILAIGTDSLGLLGSDPSSNTEISLSDLPLLVAYGAASAPILFYFFSLPIRLAFGGSGASDSFPPFHTSYAVIPAALLGLLAIGFVLMAYISCATGGECM